MVDSIIVMRNWSVAGSTHRHFFPSDTLIQAVYLCEFVPEFQRRLSGHQGGQRFGCINTEPQRGRVTSVAEWVYRTCEPEWFPRLPSTLHLHPPPSRRT
jgi:hypothetical protein